MLLIIGLLILLTTMVIAPKLQLLAGKKTVELGWMSQEWLAEHRASHPS
ncbi:MAG TPA: hypothetical protein VEK56_11305 [Vicinamibacterales bacterium]|nr:hypothetical protein [Vicinamibacterales bacterium]